MPSKKRALEDHSTTRKSKKSKIDNDPVIDPLPVSNPEVDFPRGGGTSFTPLEVKAIRAEATKEANDELFEVGALSELD
jgi:rRNA biogenesis protein RRP5